METNNTIIPQDWPPDGDIAEHLPKRYDDLIHDFPIQSYTLREGHLNLASYMPDYYLKPGRMSI